MATTTLNRGVSTGTLNKSGEKIRKEDSLFQKVGTIGRGKKKAKDEEEAAQVTQEGKHAIDSPASPQSKDINPEDCLLEEGEERCMVAPEAREDPKVSETIKLLIDWINDELASQRIVVKDIEDDLYDGQIIQKLLEKLAGVKIEVPEVSQSEEGQRQKLQVVLQFCDKILAQPSWQKPRWTAESIHSKNLVSILHLLVSLALHFRAPIRFPEHCTITVIVVQKREGKLRTRQVVEEITTVQEELGLRGEKDAFDTLFAYGPEKLSVVKKSLVTFVNKHLNKVNLEVTDLDTQVHNVGFAFELMQDAGLPKPKARHEDIVNQDLKCTLRVLYALFTKYKTQ